MRFDGVGFEDGIDEFSILGSSGSLEFLSYFPIVSPLEEVVVRILAFGGGVEPLVCT